MGAIDVWAQITTERMLKLPWMQTLLRWTGRSESALETVETTLRAMDEGNVDIALLSAWRGPEGCLISNEEVAQMVAAAPSRFRGLASVDLERPMEAVREITSAVATAMSALGHSRAHAPQQKGPTRSPHRLGRAASRHLTPPEVRLWRWGASKRPRTI
jgi:predicted TIM-barrel fold metal-dependent hydrolase